MKLRYAVLAILVAAAVMTLLALFAPSSQPPAAGNETGYFTITGLGRAGDYGYAYLDLNGTANVTLLAYQSPPLTRVVIFNDSAGLGNTSAFVQDLMPLEDYGMNVSVSGAEMLVNGTIVVAPTGAMPTYILDDLRYGTTDAVIVYVGKPDLVLGNGVTQEDWYSGLNASQKARVVVYDMSPGEFVDDNLSLRNDILENSWAAARSANALVSGNGMETYSLDMNGSEYLRAIAVMDGQEGFTDSGYLPAPQVAVDISPQSLFPWEKCDVSFSLGQTFGDAMMNITDEGTEVYSKDLGSVTETNYFPERIQLSEPGDNILLISDDSGVLGGGIIHVKDLEISYLGQQGVSYLFNVTVDGAPVDNEEVAVHLGNSTLEKDFYVSDGVLTVPAQLQQGNNTFHMSLLGTERDVGVEYSQLSLTGIYITYGIPCLILIVLIYFGARMTRRPVYVLRVGETAGEIRKDVGMSVDTALSLFKSARKELGIGHSPITAHEYSVALKRFVTDGADVTDGNVEEILQRLVHKGFLESYRQHYQLKGEGDVKRNAMVRMIRDRLIQAGVAFRMRGRHFITDRMEIGFFGDTFTKNAAAVIEDQREMSSILDAMDAKSLAALRIRMANGTFRFITLEQLDEVL
jgi:predicted transcriptional regulator